MFKVGDCVELIDDKMLGAPKGSLALVTKVWKDSIDVKWLPSKQHQQMDGGYHPKRFVLVERQMEDTREYLDAVTM